MTLDHTPVDVPELAALRELGAALRRTGQHTDAATVWSALAAFDLIMGAAEKMYRHFDKLLTEQYEERYKPGFPCMACFDATSEYAALTGHTAPVTSEVAP